MADTLPQDTTRSAGDVSVTVRQRAGSAPAPASGGKWTGPTRHYDLVKEFVAALAVVALLTTVLAALFSSPDDTPITLQSWAQAAPDDVVATITGELAGTTTSAGYGSPYNDAGGEQSIGPLHLQKWAGARIPVDPAQDFVIGPLSTVATDQPTTSALAAWKAADATQQSAWANDYGTALTAAADSGKPVAAGDYGPVPALADGWLALAKAGRIDAAMVGGGSFFGTDTTKAVLLLGDGSYLEDRADAQHLTGGQWGMMNEVGNWPGQAWLWLYTFWYQIPPFTTDGSAWADNADAIIWGLMMVFSLGLVLVPFLPGIRSIPYRVPLYRLVWRDWYRRRGA